MGLMNGMHAADPAQVEQYVKHAQEVWEGGWKCYIYKPTALASLDAVAMAYVVHSCLTMGWELASTALVFNQTGMNTEAAMFTFIRPSEQTRQ